jgi:hypothetical protein
MEHEPLLLPDDHGFGGQPALIGMLLSSSPSAALLGGDHPDPDHDFGMHGVGGGVGMAMGAGAGVHGHGAGLMGQALQQGPSAAARTVVGPTTLIVGCHCRRCRSSSRTARARTRLGCRWQRW